jgi:O-antigen ligase
MSPLLSAYIIIIACIVFGSASSILFFNRKLVSQICLLWFVAITVSFFIGIWGLLAAVLISATVFRSQHESVKVIYFIALLPALPLEKYHIPFPGINFLWDISFARLLVVCVLLPIFLGAFHRFVNFKEYRSIDIFFSLYTVLIMLLTLRNGNFINDIRSMFNIVVEFAIPYFVISRFITSPAQLNWALSGFLISTVFVSFFSIFEAHMSWRFYSQLLYSLSLEFDIWSIISIERYGIARASGGAMMQPLAAAYVCAMAIIVALYFWTKKYLSFLGFCFISLIFLYALLLTGSRGGILILAVGLLVIGFMGLKRGTRVFLGTALALATPFFAGVLFAIDLNDLDSEGTFEYRWQLILNSINAVMANPIFGAINYLDNETLEQSRQAQGIIDVVNTYLWVTLKYGFVGLFLFSMVFISIVVGVFKKTVTSTSDHKGLLLSLLTMTIVFIGTTSDVSFIIWHYVVVLGLSRAYLGFVEERQPVVQ